MTKIFRKYEFDPIEWESLKTLIQTKDLNLGVTSWKDCAVVELGFLPVTPAVVENMEVITPAVLSDKWAVDILFYAEPPAEFTPFEVLPPPMGIHTFSGDDSLYLQRYCEKYPDSPYCVITNETLGE